MIKNEVIIVDDDVDLLALLEDAFKKIGYHPTTFKTGKEGLAYLRENYSQAKLVILDRLLPDMDGIEILQELTQNSTASVPILILSVLSEEKDVLQGLQGGAIDYIGKPFDLGRLMKKAVALMGK